MVNNAAKYIFSFAVVGVLASIVLPSNVLAATINLSPGSGNMQINRPTTIDVIIDEKETSFNAAQAVITPSSNLLINDVILGDCNFSFVKTPSTADPSFVGVHLGGQDTNCKVFSLTVIPTTSTDATLAISNASVKQYGDAKELLTAVMYGNYTIGNANALQNTIANVFSNTASSADQFVPVTSAEASTITEKQVELDNYTVAVKVVDANNQPMKNADVQIDPQITDQQATPLQAKTNDEGYVEFKNVSPNVYTVTASDKKKQIAKSIINARGNKQVLTLGIQEAKSSNDSLTYILGGVLFAIMIVLVTFRNRLHLLFERNKQQQVPNSQ